MQKKQMNHTSLLPLVRVVQWPHIPLAKKAGHKVLMLEAGRDYNPKTEYTDVKTKS